MPLSHFSWHESYLLSDRLEMCTCSCVWAQVEECYIFRVTGDNLEIATAGMGLHSTFYKRTANRCFFAGVSNARPSDQKYLAKDVRVPRPRLVHGKPTFL
ncbi:unnamed protein product [Ectocarpus fasciculatus]